MAHSLRTLVARQTLNATRAPLSSARAFTTSTIHARDAPRYPFTKDTHPVHTPSASEKAQTPYPFTSSTSTSTPTSKQPEPVPPPSRPAGNIGPTGNPAKTTRAEAQNLSPMSAERMPAAQPDANAAYDYRTSAYSPVPMHVQDGSEPGDLTAAAVLSGAPTELQARTVRIFQPAKTATQSGDWHGHHWQMDWDVLGKGHRWENPLMGWQSSGDFMQATHLNFKSKEDAIRFAEKQGYEFYVQEPNTRRRIPKAYAAQYVYVPGKLKQARTK